MGESKGGWLPFQAKQHFTASNPGFVWEARIYMMPLVSVGVRDGYVNGQGGMQAKILALIPVLNEGGKLSFARAPCKGTWLRQFGSLPRYFQVRVCNGVRLMIIMPWQH